MGRPRFAIASALALCAVLGASPAAAQGPYCIELESRLAAASRAADAPWNDGATDIENAITRQQIALDDALTAARRSACPGYAFLPGRAPRANCGSLNATIGRMQANLDRLTAQRRAAFADPYAAERERSTLLRALAANQCGPQYDAYAVGPQRRGNGLFAALFGRRPGRDVWRQDNFGFTGFGYGTYRTLCVRTCDGYYFPVSFSTDSSGFERDEEACRALCPGADVALYVHRNPGEDASSMVSLAGTPYSALPAAFRFRQSYDSSCSCGAAVASSGASVVITTPGFVPGASEPVPATSEPFHQPIVRTPEARPSGFEDPETLANRTGGGGLVASPASPESSIITPDGRRIRVVGPPDYMVVR